LPELFVIPANAGAKAQVVAAVKTRVQALQRDYPGIGVEERGDEIHVTVADALRVGHEAHFAQVTSNFLKYLHDRGTLPAWERPNLLAKYFVTTAGPEMSRQGPPKPAPRIAPK